MRLNLTSQTIWHTSDMNECLPLPLYARHTKIWISQGVDWISTASGSERSLRQRSLATARGTDSSSQSRSWCAQHIALVWLFAGLRSDEIRRLRVGCIRMQGEEVKVADTDAVLPADTICWLEVPANKTGADFVKPVDRAVGEAILAWEEVRPEQPPAI